MLQLVAVCIVHDLPDRVVIAQELANNMSLAKELVGPSCHLPATCPGFLPTICHCKPQRGEAISSQATLVFGLLRYARNDKNQDGREVQGLSP